MASREIYKKLMDTSNCFTIRFSTPFLCQGVDEKVVYCDFKTYFSNIAVPDKLYLKYNDGFGCLYYNSKELCNLVVNAISKNNKYSITIEKIYDPPQGRSSYVSRTKGVATEYNKNFIDANGDILKVLEDPNTSEQYISVKEANKCGYQVYESIESAQSHMISELKDYLNAQTEIYIKIRSLRIDINDISINIQLKNMSLNQESIQSSSKMEETVSNVIKPKPRDLYNSDVLRNNSLQQSPLQSTPDTPDRNGNTSITKSENSITPNGHQSMPTKENKENYISNTSLNSDNNSAKSASRKTMTPRQLLASLRNASNRSNDSFSISSKSSKLMKLEKYPPGIAFVANSAGVQEAHLQVLQVLSSTTFSAYILSKDAFECDEIMNNVNVDTEVLTPSVGDYVMVKYSPEKLSRAFVLELKGDLYKVALVDYAIVIDVDTIYEAPSMLEKGKFPEFTCICEAPADYVKMLTVDDTTEVHSKKNYIFIDSGSNVEIKCERWMPQEFRSNAIPTNTAASIPTPKADQKIFTSLPTDEMPVQMNDVLSLTGFERGLLYLRSKDMYSKLIGMYKDCAEAEKLEKPVIIGQYVLYKTKTDKNEWRRCLVKNFTDNSVLVEYIDYFKSVELLPFADLHNLTPAAVFGPTLIKRRLRYFEDKEYSEKTTAEMKSLIRKKCTICYIQGDIIDLKLIDNDKKPLSELLLDLDMPPAKLISDLKPTKALKLDEPLKIVVLHVAEDKTFYFGASTISNDILAQLDLDHMADEPTCEDIIEGQLCVALFDDGWFRGEIKQINENRVTVYFIDFGNTDVIDKEFIKPFPDGMLEIGACALKGVLTSDSIVSSEPVVGESYLVMIKKKDGDKHEVKVLGIVQL